MGTRYFVGFWPPRNRGIALIFMLFSTLCIQAQETQTEWFKLLPRAAMDWELIAYPESPDHLMIKPRGSNDALNYQIMVLFPKTSSAYDIAMAQILVAFKEKKLLARFVLKNFGGDSVKGKTMLAESQRENYDLIFSMGSESTSFISTQTTFSQIPVVSVCSKDPVLMGQLNDYQSGSGTHIAYTSLDVPNAIQVAYLKKLKPDLKQIAILYAEKNISAVKTQVEPLVELCKKDNIETIEVAVQDQSRAKEELAEMIPETTKRLIAGDPSMSRSIYWITGSTSVFREIDTINQHAGQIPVLSAVPNVVSEGDSSAVISIGVSFENNAQIAAIYGFRILTNQAQPGSLEVGLVSPPDIAINFKRAEAIGLKIPFSFFESAIQIYDSRGILVRDKGQNVKTPEGSL